ncbi:ABC transporter ATP-binding protein [Rhizohabitans arisaemae]|uniref:ABC transporter ATP-binding protein n=1 Tax=Rhizohabitans arisaemae TaxID=2720610 RepID=UPI0024B1F208|nr:ABC transporter ATP-binding protein [Rhizohabitans arisaemae]
MKSAPRPSSLRLLLARVRPHRKMLILGGVLGFVGSMAGLAQPYLAKLAVDAFQNKESLTGPLLTLTALVLGGAVVGALSAYVLERTAESVVLAARTGLVGRILRLRIADTDRLKPGDLLSRVTADTTLLRSVCTNGLTEAFTATVTLIGAVIMMVIMDAVLLLVTLGVLVVIGAATALVLPKIKRATEEAQTAVGEMSSVLERAVGALRTVKASGAETREIATVEGAARLAWSRGLKVAGWESIAGTATWLSIQLAFLAVLGVGGARVANGSMEVSSLVAFLLYLFYLTGPLAQIIGGATMLQTGLAAIDRIREIEDLPVEPASADSFGEVPGPQRRTAAGGTPSASDGTVPAGTAPSTPDTPASVGFDRVSFQYGDDRSPAHTDVSFTAHSGGMTALVGPSGAGKSTVFALLERFYEVNDGVIAVDGRDVRDWPLDELRATIGYVEQDAPILAGTLRDNLVFAAQDATEEQIREVVARTRLTDLMDRLPEGLDTAVGHRGVLLSGGERQRVAIARALLRNPRLLLLDEATSQLDAVNELALRDVIDEVAGSTTVLVIAHRLSTVTSADRIVVFDAGRVRAEGTHEELLGSDELYRELAATQFLIGDDDLTPVPSS